MSSEGELREAHGAYAILRKENGHQICLLSCSLEYPACQDVNFTSWSNRNIFFFLSLLPPQSQLCSYFWKSIKSVQIFKSPKWQELISSQHLFFFLNVENHVAELHIQ